ncbi:MAG: hypothetical protein KAV87_07920 [Desulfobacteraceae bacterium]|nr:hypothetical protein [Desulfobacteraceae bacterium]
MASIGLAERVFDEGEGSPLMRWGHGGNATPSKSVDINGDFTGEEFIAIRFPEDDADKMPPDNNPAFSLVYDPREEDAVWPTFTAANTDINGNITELVQQGVGGLA